MNPPAGKSLLLWNLVALAVGLVPVLLFGLQLGQGPGAGADVPFRPMSTSAQWLAVIIAFGVKPVYMVLALGLIVWLWQQQATDLAALRWGLIWFWLGENGCSMDFLFCERASDFWEYVHGYGMAVGFAFIIFVFLEGFDVRVLKLSPANERCAALGLCRRCLKYEDVPCGLQRVFLFLIPALMVLAVLPLTAPFNRTSYDTNILGTVHRYCHLASSQWFEWRVCPVVALVLLAGSWLALRFKRHEPVAASKILFAAALGPLSFGLLRLFLVATYTDNLMWFDVWEELTELLFILGLGAVLWVFRQTLWTRQSGGVTLAGAPSPAGRP
jgi:hypothetical protein